MRVKRATAKRPDLRFDIAKYSSESIGKNSKDCAPVRGQIATNRIPNSRCGSNQSQDAVKSDGRCPIQMKKATKRHRRHKSNILIQDIFLNLEFLPAKV